MHQPLPEFEASACQVLRRLQRHRVAERPADHVLLDLGFLALFNAVKEHVFDVGFLGRGEGVRRAQLLIVLTDLLELLL